MDAKRFTEITGLEALKKLIQDETVFDVAGHKYYIKNSKLVRDYGGIEALDSGLTIEEVLNGTWYIKKPFDVRAEMLARPNEWVGAFKNTDRKWMMIGFDTNHFNVSIRYLSLSGYYLPNDGSNGGYGVAKNTLDKCIPIEDVPKEEL